MSAFENSLSYRPFKYPWAVEAAKKHSIEMFWDVHQVELQDDLRQVNSKDGLKTKNVSHETNRFIINKLTNVFTEMDREVAGGYIALLPYVHNNELKNMFLTFAQREVVHQRAYALLAETIGFTDSSWMEFSQYAEMRNKLEIMSTRATDGSDAFKASTILATTLCGEGIGLFGAFSVFLNYKRQGLIMGFNDVNQWSLVDEQEHVENNIRALKEAFIPFLTEAEKYALIQYIRELITAYVQAEHVFLDLIYSLGEPENMPLSEAKEYITYLGELTEFRLGLRSLAEVRKNPLEWMDWMLTATRHDAFFEKKVTDYVHRKLPGTVDYSRYRK